MSRLFSKHDLSDWMEIPRARYMDCAKRAPWGLGKWDEFKPLLKSMRECVPVPGDDWVKDIHVLVEQGTGIAEHKHDEWTAIFYVDPGDPPCAILIEGERVIPEAGQLFVLLPGVMHAVEISHSERTRISFAMLVEQPHETD